jgi:hypothetical protein
VAENLTLSINAPSSMKMLGITSTVFCVLPALVLLGLFGTCYLDGTHPWLETTSASVVGFLTPVRILQGIYAPAMLLLALASFRAGHEQ